MVEATKRIELPSGGWWELRVRPTVRDSMAFQHVGLNGSEPDDTGIMQTVSIIALLTIGRGDGVSTEVGAEPDDVLNLDMEDMQAISTVFADEVVPFLERLQGSESPRTSSSPSNKAPSRRRTRKSS